ncbi:hypothetical protein [Candidatus Rariloculus sp.]|uniref:hypothetical protein n=1 Tax=Candidatus Rariloculus sp. TaxID=3101265 RepID=UPI003D121B73
MAKAKDVVTTIPALIPRHLLSLVLRIDVCFTKQHDKKKGQGSGFVISLDPVQGPPLSEQLRKLIVEVLGGFLPPLLFVTCRHVVDYGYLRQEYGWDLSRLVVRCFDEGGIQFPPAHFPLEDICVLVPKNEKLDLALIAVKISSAGFKPIFSAASSMGTKVSSFSAARITQDLPLCDAMPWGAEIGFTSIQPWTNGYPILRSGRVSSDPKGKFQSPDIDKDDIYLLEAQSFAGSSGAPVVSYPTGHPAFDSMTITYGSGVSRDFEKYRRPTW